MYTDCMGKAKPKILVIGDVMLDKYLSGSVERISPEAPVPVLRYAREAIFLGGAGNLAANLAASDAEVILGATIGSAAENGKQLAGLLKEAGIDFADLDPQCECIVKTRITDQSGRQICRVDFETAHALTSIQIEQALQILLPLVSTVDCLVFSDYNKGLLSKALVDPLLQETKRSVPCVPVFVDGKRNPSIFEGAFLIKPNLNEMQAWAGRRLDVDKDLFSSMNVLAKKHNFGHVVCTLGARGVACVNDAGQGLVYPSRAKSVYDVSGAGDTFLAYLVSEYCRTGSLSQALVAANKAAGIAVSKRGTSVVYRAEVDADGKPDFEEARRGKKVVFTNGCFDIIHAGHIKVLSAAKRFGDILVVGLNSDASVRRLKGMTRPVNDFASRKAVLESLSFVDYVIGFEEDTPLELIKAIRPDVLVKGGDYSADNVVGNEFVSSYGGRTEIVPLLEGFSTTGIINSFKNGDY